MTGGVGPGLKRCPTPPVTRTTFPCGRANLHPRFSRCIIPLLKRNINNSFPVAHCFHRLVVMAKPTHSCNQHLLKLLFRKSTTQHCLSGRGSFPANDSAAPPAAECRSVDLNLHSRLRYFLADLCPYHRLRFCKSNCVLLSRRGRLSRARR